MSSFGFVVVLVLVAVVAQFQAEASDEVAQDTPPNTRAPSVGGERTFSAINYDPNTVGVHTLVHILLYNDLEKLRYHQSAGTLDMDDEHHYFLGIHWVLEVEKLFSDRSWERLLTHPNFEDEDENTRRLLLLSNKKFRKFEFFLPIPPDTKWELVQWSTADLEQSVVLYERTWSQEIFKLARLAGREDLLPEPFLRVKQVANVMSLHGLECPELDGAPSEHCESIRALVAAMKRNSTRDSQLIAAASGDSREDILMDGNHRAVALCLTGRTTQVLRGRSSSGWTAVWVPPALRTDDNSN